ncbi:YfaP [Acrasis kona]|uniref:YfaP n=1 Tax=Acrasis kona TaxID=1008807 RepID=A0AAW2ZNG1_9EUKA
MASDQSSLRPRITFSDNVSTPLDMSSFKLSAHIALPLARVINTLEFTNHNDKTLSGDLTFPLPVGATLVGYSLDVDGVLIDAVPINKEKAKQVFEEEVRSGKGASVVQQVANSNSFKTSIYPLHPNQTRTVQVIYSIPITSIKDKSSIELPFLSTQKTQKSAEVEWTFANPDNNLVVEFIATDKKITSNEPAQVNGNRKAVSFNNSSELSKVESILITSTETLADNQVTVQGDYFCARMRVDRPASTPVDCKKLQVLYDASYSRCDQLTTDSTLLKKILDKYPSATVVLTTFSLGLTSSQEYNSPSEALQALDKTIFDGATNLDQLEQLLDSSCDLCVIFTDGQHTLGMDITPNTTYSTPLYIINTSPSCNSQLLSHIANKSGGKFDDASRKLSHETIIQAIGQPTFSILTSDYETEQLEQVFPIEPLPVDDNGYMHVYGKLKKNVNDADITCMFKFGNQVANHITIKIQRTGDDKTVIQDKDNVIAQLWARQKLSSMSSFPEYFADEIRDLSMEWKIVSPNTSLIVLETIDQYIKHKIRPDDNLKQMVKSYEEALIAERDDFDRRKAHKIERVKVMWQARREWYEKHFEKITLDSAAPKQSYGESQSTGICAEVCYEGRQMEMEMEDCCEGEGSYFSDDDEDEDDEADDILDCLEETCHSIASACATISSDLQIRNNGSVDATISVKAWNSTAPYMSTIKSAPDPYQSYLEQRREFSKSPAFFLDVADYFLTALKQVDKGINILTNLLELELESEQLLRIVSYRLDQSKHHEEAEYLLEKVKKMRPDEPQSYRDLALIKEKLNKLPEAADLMNQVVYKDWDDRFDEIEVTALIELNHMLVKDSRLPVCDPYFVYKMDLDLRISMAWDTNDTDVDLHVTEDVIGGQSASYSNRNTIIGGHVSRDFRHGYGPEEYMLKVAPQGLYKVMVNYYANHQQSLSGGTTVLLTFFTNYMRHDEKAELVTVRLTQTANMLPVCDIKV